MHKHDTGNKEKRDTWVEIHDLHGEGCAVRNGLKPHQSLVK